MANITVSTDVDVLLQSANNAAARTSLELGATDTVEFGGFVPPSGTTAEIDAVTTAEIGQVMVDTDRKGQVRFTGASAYEDIGGLNSSAVVQVNAGASTAENGAALAAAYTKAKALTPNGLALSATNRATLLVGIGSYTLPAQLNVDAEFVDIQASNFASDLSKRIVYVDGSAISVSANDVLVYGLVAVGGLNIVGDKPLQVFRSCNSIANSFGGGGTASGTFIDCTGGISAFGGNGGTASGTFLRCIASSKSFGGDGVASGTFTSCDGDGGAFGGYTGAAGTATGTFVDCKGGLYSFGSYSTASGNFTRCVGGNDAFGKGGTLTGTLISCQTSTTFQTVSGAGKTRLCLDGTLTENNQG
tara:strand:+ start:407 stop:1486 length:1080 start_codon:yes stop_codon:yes gene_type:complete